jgi:hypothetical protein
MEVPLLLDVDQTLFLQRAAELAERAGQNPEIMPVLVTSLANAALRNADFPMVKFDSIIATARQSRHNYLSGIVGIGNVNLNFLDNELVLGRISKDHYDILAAGFTNNSSPMGLLREKP